MQVEGMVNEVERFSKEDKEKTNASLLGRFYCLPNGEAAY